jgi:phosphoribosylformylglycinamidine synthase subunit PurSL
MYFRIQVAPLPGIVDARGNSVRERISRYLELPVNAVKTRDVYSLFAEIAEPDAERIAAAVGNPVLQSAQLGESREGKFDWFIGVGFLPGVTDNVSRTLRAAAKDIIDRPLRDDEHVHSSVEYMLSGDLSRADAERIGHDLLANPLIESINVLSHDEWAESGAPVNHPEYVSSDDDEAPCHSLNFDVSDDELQAISDSNTLALSLAEMKAIQAYFRELRDGNPTDCELEVLAQTWSEHCKHKIFDAIIDYRDEETGETQRIESCFKSFIRKSTFEIAERVDWLVSVFHDNAGVIRFNDELDVVYKAETHNSPSALDPYGGAMTGIVGVNRDPMGTGLGAELKVNVWGYCFASPFTDAADVPEGLFHPARLRDQVHLGVIEGGNQSGVPYGVGWEYFDERYLGKPLVFCGTVATLPRKILGQPSSEKSIEPGDLIVMAGGRIGKDGIHGATFSSEELHGESPSQAVQIGDPITQKMLSDFIYEARDQGLYRFITDNGAGGLSSSIGEMATQCGGADIELANAPLKYAGLRPWEILLSEAQERMSFAVPPEQIDAFVALAATREVEVAVIGTFTDDGIFHVAYDGNTIARMSLEFMHDGYPRMHIPAVWKRPVHDEPPALDDPDIGDELLQLLARLNVCSGEEKGRQYDHEVKGLSVVKPYVGADNNVASDAIVSMLEPLSTEGVVLAAAVLPRYSDIDTYHMTASVIDLAVRRTVAVGGSLGHMAGLDNFCWPDPVESPKTPDGAYKAAQLVRANQALYDYTNAYNVPCISGKDSMKNDSTRGGRKISIPPTLLFSTIARMPDISKAVTLDAKRSRDLVYVLGMTHRELGGSEYFAMRGFTGNDVPKVDAKSAIRLYDAVAKATDAGLCHSLHTPALGGLGVAFAKIAIGGELGLNVELSKIPSSGQLGFDELLFSESNSRFVATVPPDRFGDFERLFIGLPCACVGRVTRDPALTFTHEGEFEAELDLESISSAYRDTLAGM